MMNDKYPFTPQVLKQAVRNFIEQMTDEEIAQFTVYGGYIGFSRNSDLSALNSADIRLVARFENRRLADETLIPGCILVGEPQDVESEDLDPEVNGNLPLEKRLTKNFKAWARKALINHIFGEGCSKPLH